LSTCKLEQGSKGWEISNQWRPHQPQWQLGMVGGNGHKGLWRRTRAMGSFWRRSYGHRQASLRYTLDSTDGIVLYHDKFPHCGKKGMLPCSIILHVYHTKWLLYTSEQKQWHHVVLLM